MDAILFFLVFVFCLPYICFLLNKLVVFAFIMLSGGIHKIPEGHVGIYWRGGAQIKGWTNPGFNFMIPTITSYNAL